MAKVTLDSLDNQRVEGLMMNAVIRLNNSTKKGNYVFNIGKSDMLCVTRYRDAVKLLEEVLINYKDLLDKDIDNMYKVRTTMEVLDEEIAKKVAE